MKIRRSLIHALISCYFPWVFGTCLIADAAPLDNQTPSHLKEEGSSDKELPSDLTEVGLESLLNMALVVTLPGRREQPASNSASAIYVLSQEDIRRSGVANVAEALRLVPGVDVARVASNKWAISVRGFNQVFANKLLVLIDGVSIFTPTTNGVIWESNELVLEDIDRIEVVRGPGAALWGSNAVNGVINIVTKHSRDTAGSLVSAGGGNKERDFGALRYGGALGENTTYRLYGSGHQREEEDLRSGGGADDEWDSFAGGGRFDTKLSTADALTVSVDQQHQTDNLLFSAPSLDFPFVDNQSFKGESEFDGTRAMVLWTHQFSSSSDLETRLSYVAKDRDAKFVSFNYDIYNVDFQHHFTPDPDSDLVYGVYYRHFENKSRGSFGHEVDPPVRNTELVSGFVQYERSIIPSTLRFILGSRFEHYELTGFEAMPNVRLLYTPTKSTTLWGAVSRAATQPGIFFEDTKLPLITVPVPDAPLPGLVTSFGNRKLSTETLLGYEVGMRTKFESRLSLDTTVFYNHYNDIFSLENGTPFVEPVLGQARPAIVIPLIFDNKLSGDSYGAEIALEWRPFEWWQLTGSYSYITIDIDLNDSTDTGDKGLIEGGTPENQLGLRSHLKLNDDIGFDSFLRYVDRVSSGDIDSYFDLNLHLSWQMQRYCEFSLVGENLLHDSHNEFVGNLFGPPPTSIERSFWGKVTFTF